MKKNLLFFVILLLSIFLIACNNNVGEVDMEADNEGEIVVVDWGGAGTEARIEATYKPFEEKYGIKVISESPTDYGKLKAMVESGNVTWDVVNVGNDFVEQAGQAGLLEEIDYDIISTENIMPEYVHKYGMGAEQYSVVLAYSTEAFSEDEAPSDWKDFWDVERFPGPRGLWKGQPRETLEIALLADGVSSEELYPLDLDRAFASLEKLKEKTDIVWWETGAQPPELLSSGNVVMSSAWNGRIVEAKRRGAPVEIVYNNAIATGESWVVPKGSKNKDLAMKFIAFASDVESQAAFAEAMHYSPINYKAIEALPKEVQEQLGQSEENLKTQIPFNDQYWAEHLEEVTIRFQEWLVQSE